MAKQKRRYPKPCALKKAIRAGFVTRLRNANLDTVGPYRVEELIEAVARIRDGENL